MKTRLEPIDGALVRRWAADLPTATVNDMAIPSYFHRNPLIRWLFRRRLEVMLQMTVAGRHERVLDFGCGIGLMALNLAHRCRVVYAHDIELRIARKTVEHFDLTNVSLLAGDQWHQDIEAGTLDAIIAADVLEHLEDLEGIGAVFDRLLAKDGRIILSGPTEHWIYRIGRWAAGFKNEYHERDIHSIRRFFCERGLEVTAEKRLPLRWGVDAFHVITLARKR